MERIHWLRGWTIKRSRARTRRQSHAGTPAVTELLEVRTLLSATTLDTDPEAADTELPENVAVNLEPGYFEVAVGVPAEVFDIDWPVPIILLDDPSIDPTIDPIEIDPPILIDNGGLMPLDGEPGEFETAEDIATGFDLLDFLPPDFDFDFGQDILVSVGMFGFPLAEMFGGELPDEEGLNDFLANGPSDGGFLSTLLEQVEAAGDVDSEFAPDILSFFTSGALTHVSLHDDGIEVSASLYELMHAPPFDNPDDIFARPFESDFGDEFEDGPAMEDGDEDDEPFPGDLEVTVQVDGLPAEFAPDWMRSDFVLPPFFPILLDDDDPGTETEEPDVFSFESSVPVGELMAEALFGAVFYTLDSDPDFEFTEPVDFEPDPSEFGFTLGLHLVDFGEPDEGGQIPDLGIDADYTYAVTLVELAGSGAEFFGNDEDAATDAGMDGTSDDTPSTDDADSGGGLLAFIATPPGDDTGEAEENDAADGDGTVKEPFDFATLVGNDTETDPVTTIRLSLQFVNGEDGEPAMQPTFDPEPQSLVAIEFNDSNVQLNEGTLTIDLPETEPGGWTATASGSDLIIDFESNDRDFSHTVSLVGTTTLVINGTQFDDFVELDLTDLGVPDLVSAAVHGGEGDDTLDLIGAGKNRFDEILLSGGAGDDFASVGLSHAAVVLRGGDGRDVLSGGKGDDEIFGGAGDDLLDGGGGNDQLHGGRNNDVILGGGGHDSMWGGAGDDHIVGHSGRDRAFGGSGSDTIMGGRGPDRARGGSGDDVLDGGAGRDILRGGGGNDALKGRSGNDRLFGGDGNDSMDGSAGRDFMKGGRGDDDLRGGRGNDRMFGGRGRDSMFGSRGEDELSGGEGSDSVFGNDGDDTVVGLQDDDIWEGGRGGNARVMSREQMRLALIDPVGDPSFADPGEVGDMPFKTPPVFLGPPDTMPLETDESPADNPAETDDIDAGFEDVDDMLDVI